MAQTGEATMERGMKWIAELWKRKKANLRKINAEKEGENDQPLRMIHLKLVDIARSIDTEAIRVPWGALVVTDDKERRITPAPAINLNTTVCW
jgi:hypothetical protein